MFDWLRKLFGRKASQQVIVPPAEYYNMKLAEIPNDVLLKAIRVLSDNIPDYAKKEIREDIDEKGLNEWSYLYHHGWGTSIRNLLRKNGLMDNMLPDGNWDDYYHQIVEIVVGARPMPKEK